MTDPVTTEVVAAPAAAAKTKPALGPLESVVRPVFTNDISQIDSVAIGPDTLCRKKSADGAESYFLARNPHYIPSYRTPERQVRKPAAVEIHTATGWTPLPSALGLVLIVGPTSSGKTTLLRHGLRTSSKIAQLRYCESDDDSSSVPVTVLNTYHDVLMVLMSAYDGRCLGIDSFRDILYRNDPASGTGERGVAQRLFTQISQLDDALRAAGSLVFVTLNPMLSVSADEADRNRYRAVVDRVVSGVSSLAYGPEADGRLLWTPRGRGAPRVPVSFKIDLARLHASKDADADLVIASGDDWAATGEPAHIPADRFAVTDDVGLGSGDSIGRVRRYGDFLKNPKS